VSPSLATRHCAEMTRLFSFAGRHGPAILFLGMLVGLLVPSAADVSKPLMGAAVFVFTLGAFLKVDRTSMQSQLTRPIVLAGLLGWIVLGVPLVALAILSSLPLSAEMKTGVLLCALAPPVGSAAAMAAMLRLDTALALATTVIASLLAPFTLPAMALALGGVHLELDVTGLVVRIACVVGGAGLVAALLRRFAGRAVRDNPSAMTGISVLGLIVVATGAMQGMDALFIDHPRNVALALGVAFAFNIGMQVLGAALFMRQGAAQALTVGLLSGNRNVTLVWVAVLPWIAQQTEVNLMLAASVFPIFMLPLPMGRLLDASRRRRLADTSKAANRHCPVEAVSRERLGPVAESGGRPTASFIALARISSHRVATTPELNRRKGRRVGSSASEDDKTCAQC
jgi:arsenite transporter